MPDPFIFRLATREDDDRILELFKTSFNRTFQKDWWHWFSYQCPTGLNRTTVVEDSISGKLAGSYSLLPIKFRFSGKIVRTSLCTNVNIHPEYRTRSMLKRFGNNARLFTRIGHYALSQEKAYDTSISLGMPNRKAYSGHMKVGWEVLFTLPFLVKYKPKARNHQCREIELFDQSFDAFFKKITDRFSIIVLKDYHFMNWRVAYRPDIQYTKFVYEENSKLRGYVVLKKFNDKDYLKTHILDIQADTIDVLDELMAASESFAHGRDELNLWTNSHNPYHSYFLKSGFAEKESQDLLIIHYNYGEKESATDGPKWFCLADNDVY